MVDPRREGLKLCLPHREDGEVVEAVEASLLGLSAEAVVGVDGPVKRDPPASSRFNSQPLHVFCQHPEVRELYAVSRFATRKRVYNQIDK